jgi:hypothetical protein
LTGQSGQQDTRFVSHIETAATVPVVGAKPDADFLFDMDLISRGEPGKGQALQRMIDRAGTTHATLAEALGLSRSYITMWCSESKWPNETQLRNALLRLNIDRKTILTYMGPVLVSSDNELDPNALAVTVISKLFAVDDPFERETVIYDTIYEKALISQGIKATKDTRAFEAFCERYDKHQEESRKRGSNEARNVTPQQSAWNAGQDVTEASSRPVDTTTSSETTPDNSAEPKPSADLVDNKQA